MKCISHWIIESGCWRPLLWIHTFRWRNRINSHGTLFRLQREKYQPVTLTIGTSQHWNPAFTLIELFVLWPFLHTGANWELLDSFSLSKQVNIAYTFVDKKCKNFNWIKALKAYLEFSLPYYSANPIHHRKNTFQLKQKQSIDDGLNPRSESILIVYSPSCHSKPDFYCILFFPVGHEISYLV